MLKGIDTSHYSKLDPHTLSQMVQANQLYFNFLKATEGQTIQDSAFVSYWQMSRDAGLLCGAYHFLRPQSDPAQQANNFLTQYKKVSRNGVLPPVVDIEWVYVNDPSNPGKQVEQWAQLAPKQRVQNIRTFMFQIEQSLNVQPIIYTAPSFWNSLVQPQLSDDDTAYFKQHQLWVVDLKGTGQLPATWSSAAFTQTHFGESAQSNNPYAVLDQDVFNGNTLGLLNTTVGGLTIAKGFPKSNVVKDIQQALINKQFLHDAADGIFGNNTDAAVRAFQSANGLVSNGIIDNQTWNKILS